MKVIYCLSLALALAACKKNSGSENTSIPEPSITKVSFYRVYAGSNVSVGFTVDLIADSADVDKVTLFLYPSAMRWEVPHPKTGRYIMYDHVGDYPTYPQNVRYFFEFLRHNGQKVTTEPFQVY